MLECDCQAFIDRLNCPNNEFNVAKLVAMCTFIANCNDCQFPFVHHNQSTYSNKETVEQENKLRSIANSALWAGGSMLVTRTTYELLPPTMRFLIPLTAVGYVIIPKFGTQLKHYGDYVFNMGKTIFNKIPFQLSRKEVSKQTSDTDFATLNSLIEIIKQQQGLAKIQEGNKLN